MSKIAHRPAVDGKTSQAHAFLFPFAGLYQFLRRWQTRRETTQLLHSLDDRSLRDIGLTRSDIERAAHATEFDPRWN